MFLTSQRFASDDASRGHTMSKQDHAPHVSEEAAALDESMGETPPDLSQGTPVQEVCISSRNFDIC